MKKATRRLNLTILSSAILLSTACGNFNIVGGDNRTRPAGWSDDSHSDNATPNYDVVFAQNKVHRMDVTISARDWKLMQDNMTELFGKGGERGAGGPGGFTLPEGLPADWRPGDPIPEGVTWPEGFPVPGERPDGAGGPGAGGPGAGGPPGGGGLDFADENPIYRPATISYEGQTWNHVGIRFKGNSSLRSSWGSTLKLPLRFDFDEFENTYPEINDQRFFGFKRLSLSSGFSDSTLIREKVAADIFRAAGVPAAQTAFYRLYLNYGEGSKYFGLYTMVEIPDTPMFQTQFLKEGGNLYKPSGTGAQFTQFNQDSFPIKTNEENANWNDIQAVFSALNADRSNAAQWRTGLERVFDVTGFLRYLAVNNVIENWDSYGSMAHNYYLYNDPGDNLIHWIPWDHNMSMGGNIGGGRPGGDIFQAPDPTDINTTQVDPTAPADVAAEPLNNPRPGGGFGRSVSLDMKTVTDQWPLIRFLADDPVYFEKYTVFVKETVEKAFNKEKTEAYFRQQHDLIRPYVIGAEGEQEDATLLQSPESFETGFDSLIEHITKRHEAVAEYLAQKKSD